MTTTFVQYTNRVHRDFCDAGSETTFCMRWNETDRKSLQGKRHAQACESRSGRSSVSLGDEAASRSLMVWQVPRPEAHLKLDIQLYGCMEESLGLYTRDGWIQAFGVFYIMLHRCCLRLTARFYTT